MRIALAQTNIIWEDKQANLVRAEVFLASADAEVVLFPEMSLTGFSMHTDVTAEICQSDDPLRADIWQSGNSRIINNWLDTRTDSGACKAVPQDDRHWLGEKNGTTMRESLFDCNAGWKNRNGLCQDPSIFLW